MCFPRKAGLGKYNGTKDEWLVAYREARIYARNSSEPDPAKDGVEWKALLIVFFEREEQDYFGMPVLCRLESKRLIDRLLSEEPVVTGD